MKPKASTTSISTRLALAAAALGACAALSGCEAMMNGTHMEAREALAQQSQPTRVKYLGRKVGNYYEGIALNPDGTYSRTIVDNWGRNHQQQGTWRGFGGTVRAGKYKVDRRLELNSYSTARDILHAGDAQSAPKSTTTISPGEFYTE